ncbi:MAG: hypothetical protein U0892_12780 [Pirellulales bacterium]
MRLGSCVRCCFCMLAVAVLSLTGCGEANPRMEVKGSVSLKGTPLKEGTILFMPLTGGEGVTQEGGLIKEGKYLLPKESGLAPGKYKVILSAGDAKAPEDPNAIPGPTGNYVMKELIPPEYNAKSKVEVEVKSSGENVFDFPIP